jgi:hypothetical protein
MVAVAQVAATVNYARAIVAGHRQGQQVSHRAVGGFASEHPGEDE